MRHQRSPRATERTPLAAAEAQQVFESPPVHLPIARVPPASRRRTRPARCLAQTQRVFESLPPAARRTVLIGFAAAVGVATLYLPHGARVDAVALLVLSSALLLRWHQNRDRAERPSSSSLAALSRGSAPHPLGRRPPGGPRLTMV